MGSRAEMFERLASRDHQFDLVIIGGGITGCGVAHAAAARGAKVLLVEQADFASGTSSRSTKLIHGGIRYLKQFDFRLVREGVRERQALIEAAPYLVHPVSFLYPVHAGDPDALWALRLGLLLYDWFAGRHNLLRHQMLSREALLAVEPILRADELRGGALYADCLTDDARLTIETAKAAAAAGAILINYMAVERVHYDSSGRIAGVTVVDRLDEDRAYRCDAPVVLNAAGPWVDQVRRLDDPVAAPLLRLTKGVHITVQRERLPIHHPVVMHAADGRLMFAVPRGEHTYLGTTDTDFAGDPREAQVEREDVRYILTAVNRTFPASHLNEDDVRSNWVGVRSLAATRAGAGPSQVSRDYRLHVSPTGLVSVAGGKLTAFAAMARAIVRTILPEVGNAPAPLLLPGAADLPTSAELTSLAQGAGVSERGLQDLVDRHGSGVRRIVPLLDGEGEEGARMLAAEALYAIEHEFAVTLTDVMARRTAQLLFGNGGERDRAMAVAQAMQRAIGWSDEQTQAQLEAYRAEVEAMFAWRRSSVDT